jgi:amidophosphoribosyltransferase
MCGIIGLSGKSDIIHDLLFGLSTLQHRGQNSCGIATFNDIFHVHKGQGLLSQVFSEVEIEQLKGEIGIGHVRYATQGGNNDANVQPFTSNFPFGIAMIHNGNILNFEELRKRLNEENHYLLETSNDLELILYMFASQLAKKNLSQLSIDDIYDAVRCTQQTAVGAYAVIALIAKRGLLAFTDPHGLRPLVIGKRETPSGTLYGFASESTTFDFLGFQTIDDVQPGEAVFIDAQNNLHRKKCLTNKRAFCVFEYIYFAREDSILMKRLVAEERMRMGKLLAKKVRKLNLQPDIVIDVPSSAYFFAKTLADELQIPYMRGLAKNNHIGRSFILSTQKEREQAARLKLNPIKKFIEGKKIAVVDDSIVRGTTSKHIVNLLRNAGAKEIYFVSAAPPVKHPCVYGIDMAISSELIGRNTFNEIAEYLGVDELVYQSLSELQELYKDASLCYACFNGNYPVENSKQYLELIETERAQSTGSNGESFPFNGSRRFGGNII